MDFYPLRIANHVIFCVITVAALLGNSLVVASVAKFSFLRSSANLLVAALAVSDMIIAATTPVNLALFEVALRLPESGIATWSVACRLYVGVALVGVFGDVFCVFGITLDRFLCVNFPLRYPAWVTETRVKAFLGGCAVVCVVWAFCLVFLPDRLRYGDQCTTWTLVDPTLQGAVWFPVFSIITIICVSVYVRMWVLARRARTQIQDLSVGVGGAGAGAGAAAMLHKAQRKTTLSLLLVSGVYLSTNVVYLATYYLTVNKFSDASVLAQFFTAWFWQVNVWINPFIYGFRNRDFKRAFRKLLRLPAATEDETSINSVSARA